MNNKIITMCAVLIAVTMLLPMSFSFIAPGNGVPSTDFNSMPAIFDAPDSVEFETVNIPPVAIIGDLVSGYQGSYYNLPADHPDIEGNITGVVTGDTPFNHDWYDAQYLSFERNDPNLAFGNDFFPVDEGLPGDPNYFAVHWQTNITVPDADNYTFLMGSDDDSWLYIDDFMVIDLGGIHALNEDIGAIYLEPGVHSLNIYFAERHLTQSGFYFEFLDPRVEVSVTVIWDDIQAEVGEPVYLKGSCSYDLDGNIQSYSWDFGDGIVGTESDMTHSYARPGNYTVTLTVTDNAGAKNMDTCNVDIYGDYVDLFLTEQDITVGEPLAINELSSVAVTVHCRDPYAEVIPSGTSISGTDTGVRCSLTVYMDQVSGASSIFTDDNVRIPSNGQTALNFDWTPPVSGAHDLIAVISDADPAEMNLMNNTAIIRVEVTEEIILGPANVQYWIEYIYPADQTIVDENGIYFYTSGAYPEKTEFIPYNASFRIPEVDYGVYPLYNCSMPLYYRLHILNLDSLEQTGIEVEVIQERHNTMTIWDSLGEISLIKGQQLEGTLPLHWTFTLAPNQELVLNGYHIFTGRGWGLDQTHLIISQNGTILVDDSEAGVYCPP
ncbi:MAG: PKD domain-containing protein [Thermoplasmata archaeon]|nr:PKD domain-containing protein [Thermoplasmata archaeon]